MRFRPRLAEPKSLRDGSRELFSKQILRRKCLHDDCNVSHVRELKGSFIGCCRHFGLLRRF